jgi:hypothetical protein
MKKYSVIFALAARMFQTAAAQESGIAKTTGKPLNEIKLDLTPLFVPSFFSELVLEQAQIPNDKD